MRGADDVVRIFEGHLTPFGGIGIAIAVGLLVALRLALSPPATRLVRAPFGLLLAHLAIVVLRAVLPDPAPEVMRPIDLLGLTLLLLSIGRAGYLLLLHGILERGRSQRGLPGIIRDMLQVGVYLVVALYVLHRAGVDPGSLLTTSAVLTAVIGFALQDTLGNLFAGLAIQLQQPFEVGDWIQFDDDPDHIGEVIEINWRATRILTIARVEVTVPNNLLAKAPIRNYSKPTRLVRRFATVIAPYETPPARVHRLLTEAVVEVDGVRSHPAPDIQTMQFTERGVEYQVRYFIEDFDQREILDGRVRDRLWYALRRAAVPIPAPQRRRDHDRAHRRERGAGVAGAHRGRGARARAPAPLQAAPARPPARAGHAHRAAPLRARRARDPAGRLRRGAVHRGAGKGGGGGRPAPRHGARGDARSPRLLRRDEPAHRRAAPRHGARRGGGRAAGGVQGGAPAHPRGVPGAGHAHQRGPRAARGRARASSARRGGRSTTSTPSGAASS
ncbi:MAG: mechanosensitive ion channel family protein [Sandaracinaceae bacterium]|nr:mechanosensitive ion channel family protein [Sandaracinaceae bacterium]